MLFTTGTNAPPLSETWLYSNGRIAPVAGLEPSFVVGTAVNASDQVVGYSSHAFLNTGGAVTDLGDLGLVYYKMSFAHAINDAGIVVGESANAFYYDGAMHDINALPHSPYWSMAEAVGINAANQIVVNCLRSGGYGVCIYTIGGGFTYLHTLGGKWTTASHGINARGQIAGSSQLKKGHHHAFLTRGRNLLDLGTLGGSNSDASGLNDLGQVVGTSEMVGGREHAFIYEDGKMLDLDAAYFSNRPRPRQTTLVAARAINNRGQIAALLAHDAAKNPNDDYVEGLLLTPLPAITIAGGNALSTRRPRLVIRGRAGNGATEVAWHGSGGAFRPANGVASWHFAAKLKPGKNHITIRARDIDGATSTARLIVTRN